MKNDNKAVKKLNCTSRMVAEMLDKTKWADCFSWKQLLKLGEYMRAYTVMKGIVIFEEGDVDESVHIIVKGAVDIIMTDQKEKAINTIATIAAPQSFGEMCLIDGEPRSAQAKASTDVVMLRLTKDRFMALAQEVPLLALTLMWNMSRMVSRRLRRTNGKLAEYLLNRDA